MTEIDSLQISIETSSGNAAKGINDLATALGKLKDNGKITSAVKNLNSLRDALKSFGNASSSANSLTSLASSLEKLKSVGSVTSIGNSLTKLATSLKSLDTVTVDKGKIDNIASALGSLSEVKAGGINTMMNGLMKIGQVTKALDDEAIDAFADRIEKLTEKLTPLSAKMTTIRSGLKAVNSSARSAGSGVKQMGGDLDAASINMSSFINLVQQAVQWLQQAIQKLSEFMSEAIEWDGIAARFGRGFGSQAQETYDWIQRLNEEMGINIQQFMQYSSVYATMLTGFGVANEDATKMALGYTELTYDIWAGYNDIYKNFADAAEAVKSAIAGEVEPIRRAGFTIIESTLEQTAANHGLEISLANATEAQKSYLRYLTLVDQAHAQGLVGTYAKELNTAEGLTRTLAQQTKSLTQAFGSLFLPILVRMLPWIQAFVELITDAIKALAAFLGVTIQDVDWSGYGDSIGGAAENTGTLGENATEATEALKDLKKATLGIDELNVISPPSASSSGGSGTGGGTGSGFDGLDVDSLWDETIFDSIQSDVDAIKEKLKGWLPVIEGIAIAFGTLSLATLIAEIGESMEKIGKMEGLLGGLKKTLAGLAILTIEAVLVFMFADEYLETGNLLPLIGEALATAAGGYLMYKGFGTKGLVLSLAVSIAAQLAAITLNLADGGVEISDPELWIQSAFTTALGGVSGGILAYKGLINVSTGKGVGLGLLAVASLTLAAITIGEITANGEVTKESILTGIGSIAAAAGFGFMVGGPWGAAIGAGVALTINVVGAAIGTISANAKKSAEEDLKDRFGEIELTIEETKAYVEKITAIPRSVTIDANVWNEELGSFEVQTMTVPVDVALDIFVEEKNVLESLQSKVNSLAENITRDAMKIMLGIDISHDDYQADIETYVNQAQGYLDQYYLTTSIAIGISSGESTSGLTSALSAFYTTSSAELQTLGAKLKQTVSDAFVDGEWIPDKLQEALELQKEIQDILDYTSDVEYRATLEKLKLDISGTDLTAESFKNIVSGTQKAIAKKLETLEEVKMSKLQVAVMQYDANIEAGMSEAEAKKIYDQTVADIQTEYQNGKVEVTFGSFDFGIDTLQEAFAAELEKLGRFDYEASVTTTIEAPMFNVEIIDGDSGARYSNIQSLMDSLRADINSQMFSITGETRENVAELLETLEPTSEELEQVAAANRAAGLAVPQNVRDGLNDLRELEAVTGSVDAINYMIGQGFSTDTTFLNTLATVENAGAKIPDSVAEGLLNNLDYVTDEATGLVTGIKNSITGEVTAVTPTLVDNMEQLGVDLNTGLLEGAESEMQAEKKSWLDWAIWPWNWFKETNEINSPSKLFERGGQYLTEGLSNGMKKNSLSGKLGEIWESAKTWWNGKTDLKSYTPSIGSIKDKVSSAWSSAKTWWDTKKSALKSYTPSIGSIYEKVKERWDSARTWWNEKKTAMKSYTPSIGSIYEKVKVRWDNAREWWNEKKTGMKSYTPSIGSITDKVKSAWNSAKSWWNKNVGGLTTKLNVQVPKIKVQWDTASAFGKSFKYPTGFKLEFAAGGGIFDQGSLVWAGERGPEVVANAAGGKTGVMNVQQMQDAVYEGVYSAVVAAMRSNGGAAHQQAVNVYLDGRQITTAVEQRQRERGASIMGNQVYSYG